MSRGHGRTQRAVLAALREHPERQVSRRYLEDELVGGEDGASASNLLRAIKALEREGHLVLRDVADKERATVRLCASAPASDEKVRELLAEIAQGGGR